MKTLYMGTLTYPSTGAKLEGPSDSGATRTREVDTEFDKDSQAQFERVQRLLKEREEKEKAGIEPSGPVRLIKRV